MLDGYIEKFIVSFIDDYKNVRKNYNILRYKELSEDDYKEIGTFFSSVAKEHGMTVQTCAEKRNLVEYGFIEGECISHEVAYILTGKKFKSQKIRPNVNCHCVETVDIGEYNTCSHLCKYCYASFDEDRIKENRKLHDVNSPLLIGHLEDDDIIKIRC